MVLRLTAALGLLVCSSGEPTVIFRSNFTEPPWVAIYHVRSFVCREAERIVLPPAGLLRGIDSVLRCDSLG